MSEATAELFGFLFRNVTLDEAVDLVIRSARAGERRIVFFLNAHCINIAARDEAYSKGVHEADCVYADGSGLALAALLAGFRFVDNVNGTDLFPKLCERAAREGVPIGLLGAGPGRAQSTAENMKARYSDLSVPFVHHGFFSQDEEEDLIEQINDSGIGVLLVAFGVPRQELWVTRCASRLKVPVIMAVGGLLDFYSGSVPRAPLILRKCGMEWFFRLSMEPRRMFVRYVLGNPLFIARSLRLRALGRENLRCGGRIFAIKRG